MTSIQSGSSITNRMITVSLCFFSSEDR